LTVSDLATDFGKSNADISWGITLVLMLRSVGSILFGIAADRYGRKWPFVVNNVLFIILELVGNPAGVEGAPATSRCRCRPVVTAR
jgi:SHS family lactate transporter-like MFS transporter